MSFITSRSVIGAVGPYLIIEGYLMMPPRGGEVMRYWVEHEGRCVSEFTTFEDVAFETAENLSCGDTDSDY